MSLGDFDLHRVADPELLREWMEEDEFQDGGDELDWLLDTRQAQGAIDAEAAESLRQAHELLASSERDYELVKPVAEGLLTDAADDESAPAGTMAAARKVPRAHARGPHARGRHGCRSA